MIEKCKPPGLRNQGGKPSDPPYGTLTNKTLTQTLIYKANYNMNNFLPEYKDKLQILTNELNLSLKMIKYSFLKVHEKMFFTHENGFKNFMG